MNNELRYSLVNASVTIPREIVQYVINENLVVSSDHPWSLMFIKLIKAAMVGKRQGNGDNLHFIGILDIDVLGCKNHILLISLLHITSD